MRYEYIFYERDVTFDYGDFPGGTCSGIEKNGFSIEIDKDDNVDVSSLEGFGDFQFIERDIKSPDALIDFIENHKMYIESTNDTPVEMNKELFEELVKFLKGGKMTELNAIVDEMLDTKDKIACCKFELKRLEEQEELLNIKLLGELKKHNCQEMVLPNCKFGLKTVQRTAFDQKLFSSENPELFEKYKITKKSERFEFKIGNFN